MRSYLSLHCEGMHVAGQFWVDRLFDPYGPPELVPAVLQLWDEHDDLLHALDRLPQTFCHRDVFSRNLFL